MNDTALREALHEVASVGVGRMWTPASHDSPPRHARVERRPARGIPRRGWAVGALGVAAAAVVVLLVVGLFAMTRPAEVVPASGPGSLPDQIFPTRSTS